MFERGELKTKGKASEKKKGSDVPKKEMTITAWRELQGFTDTTLIERLLQKVVDKEFTLEEMSKELHKYVVCILE